MGRRSPQAHRGGVHRVMLDDVQVGPLEAVSGAQAVDQILEARLLAPLHRPRPQLGESGVGRPQPQPNCAHGGRGDGQGEPQQRVKPDHPADRRDEQPGEGGGGGDQGDGGGNSTRYASWVARRGCRGLVSDLGTAGDPPRRGRQVESCRQQGLIVTSLDAVIGDPARRVSPTSFGATIGDPARRVATGRAETAMRS